MRDYYFQNPDYIFLSHIHWDHFQGPSLRRFNKDTIILIPQDPFERMKEDLKKIGINAYNCIKKNNSIEKVAEKYKAVYFQ